MHYQSPGLRSLDTVNGVCLDGSAAIGSGPPVGSCESGGANVGIDCGTGAARAPYDGCKDGSVDGNPLVSGSCEVGTIFSASGSACSNGQGV